MLIVSVLLLMGSLTARVLGADLSWTTPVVFLGNSFTFFVLWRLTKRRTVLSREGVAVHDGFRTRRVTWAQVDGLQAHGRYDQVVRLRLANDDHLGLPAVERKDLPEVAQLIETQGKGRE